MSVTEQALPGTMVPSASLVSPGGGQGAQGIQGPTGVSADSGNIATLGSDNLILVPQSKIWSVRQLGYSSIGNPGFEVDQANIGTSVTIAASNRLVDRWFGFKAGTMALTGQQFTATTLPTIPGGSNFGISRNYLRITLTTAQASLAAGDNVQIFQFVEGPKFRQLINDVHSCSLLVRSSVASLKFSLSLRDSPATQTLVKLCTTSATANIWTFVPLGNMPVFPTGNFTTAAGSVGYALGINLAVGSSIIAPAADVWGAGSYLGAPGMSNFAASAVNSTFDCALVSHEPGSQCSNPPLDCPFQQAYDDSLRYYCKSYDYETIPGTATATGSLPLTQQTTTNFTAPLRFPKAMAKIPTMTAYNHATGAINSTRFIGADYAVTSFGNISKGGCWGVNTATLPAVAAGNSGTLMYTADTGW
jgi:hypothetical protein